mmetsp:Transcript_32825/g.81724  ORF Transcript_32825/g.81724 Transcript_32825/m.81724 type:complete len:239 (-) Transcript_32825:699-1415(-)
MAKVVSFVVERTAVHRLAACAVSEDEVASLHERAVDDAMKRRALVRQWPARQRVVPLVARAKVQEVSRGLGQLVREELKRDLADQLPIDLNGEVALRERALPALRSAQRGPLPKRLRVNALDLFLYHLLLNVLGGGHTFLEVLQLLANLARGWLELRRLNQVGLGALELMQPKVGCRPTVVRLCHLAVLIEHLLARHQCFAVLAQLVEAVRLVEKAADHNASTFRLPAFRWYEAILVN